MCIFHYFVLLGFLVIRWVTISTRRTCICAASASTTPPIKRVEHASESNSWWRWCGYYKRSVDRSACGGFHWRIQTSVCSSDKAVDLRKSQVFRKPIARIDSNVNPRVWAVVEMPDIFGVLNETHPAEVVAALLTWKCTLVSDTTADVDLVRDLHVM